MSAYEQHIQSMTVEELQEMMKDCEEKRETSTSPTFRKAMDGLIEKCKAELNKKVVTA